MIVEQRLRMGAANSSRGAKRLVGDVVKHSIDNQAWPTIEYPDAIYEEDTGRWISRAKVAEINITTVPRPRSPSAFPAAW